MKKKATQRKQHSYPPSEHAFTLVELSIVLVILGLLVGGVLAGQSLIRAAEMRSVATQATNYVTAVNTFRDKYFALPGDITNATAFWGAAHATPATCITTIGTGTQTCNGNGNGQVQFTDGGNESFRFWQHLANAGLIEGKYSGVENGCGYCANSSDSPSGRISGTLWFVYTLGVISGPTYGYLFDGNYTNVLVFGGAGAGDPSNGALRSDELWNIDTKIDDGRPATGRVVPRMNTIGQCTSASVNSDMNATYLLSSSTLCALMMRQAF